jgi:hypothetical protein
MKEDIEYAIARAITRAVYKNDLFIELLTEDEQTYTGARKSWTVKKPPTNTQLMNKLNEIIKVLNKVTNPGVGE